MAENVTLIRTPIQAPKANAIAERWTPLVHEECVDKILIRNERHLHRVLTRYVDSYKHARPHQGMAQQCPIPLGRAQSDDPVERRDLLGGVLHDYYRRAT